MDYGGCARLFEVGKGYLKLGKAICEECELVICKLGYVG